MISHRSLPPHFSLSYRSLRNAVILICGLVLSVSATAQVERTGPLALDGVSDALKQAVEDKGYRVHVDAWAADLWFAKQLKLSSRDIPGAVYPELTNGEFIGVANLKQGMTDFRGQAIPAGTYTLRYQLLPQDGNHMGVSPNPDFLLAIPAASDPNPEQNYLYKKLIALSAKSTGANHPAVIALDEAGEAAALAKDAHRTVVFSVAIPATGAASTLKLGIVVHGTAAQ